MPGQNLNGKKARAPGDLLSSKPVVFLLILLILSKSLLTLRFCDANSVGDSLTSFDSRVIVQAANHFKTNLGSGQLGELRS